MGSQPWPQQQQRQDNNDNDSDSSSSLSSNDLLNTTTGFKKKERIENYYDFYRLKHHDNNKKKDDPKTKTNSSNSAEVGNHQKYINTDNNLLQPSILESSAAAEALPLPPEVPIPDNATWQIVLLMDHREFGCANNFLQTVETKINEHFGCKYSEITTLPSADYLYVARLISNDDTTGNNKILDERVLDMVIERKNVSDACSCLIATSKKYKPLSFFEAQMYKLQNCGVSHKLFLMEGDEHTTKSFFRGAKTQSEKERRLKRVKSLRLQLEQDEFEGVTLLCTRNKYDTIKFLIYQLEQFQKTFNPRRPPTKTREQLKDYINAQMKTPTFMEYLRLRSIPGIGDVKAMKVCICLSVSL